MLQLSEQNMALERVFTRVLKRLPEDDAIALAPQKDKVIQLLHKELLAEGLLMVKEGGGASAPRLGVVAAPQKNFSVSSLRAESLTGNLYNIRDVHRSMQTSIKCICLNSLIPSDQVSLDVAASL